MVVYVQVDVLLKVQSARLDSLPCTLHDTPLNSLYEEFDLPYRSSVIIPKITGVMIGNMVMQ